MWKNRFASVHVPSRFDHSPVAEPTKGSVRPLLHAVRGWSSH